MMLTMGLWGKVRKKEAKYNTLGRLAGSHGLAPSGLHRGIPRRLRACAADFQSRIAPTVAHIFQIWRTLPFPCFSTLSRVEIG